MFATFTTKLINACVIFVNVYYFNRNVEKVLSNRYENLENTKNTKTKKFTKQLTLRLSSRFICSNCLGMNILLTAARTNWNFEFARTANTLYIQYKLYKPFEKMSTFIISVW